MCSVMRYSTSDVLLCTQKPFLPHFPGMALFSFSLVFVVWQNMRPVAHLPVAAFHIRSRQYPPLLLSGREWHGPLFSWGVELISGDGPLFGAPPWLRPIECFSSFSFFVVPCWVILPRGMDPIDWCDWYRLHYCRWFGFYWGG